jgi:hypothetical protein
MTYPLEIGRRPPGSYHPTDGPTISMEEESMATGPTRRPRSRPPSRRPTDDEIKQALKAARLIDSSTVQLMGRDEDGAESRVELPPLALALLTQVLEEARRRLEGPGDLGRVAA